MRLDYNCVIDFSEISELEKSEFKIGDKKTVLCVIDMNKGFAKKGALYSERVESIIPEVEKIVQRFANLNSPIIAFTDCHSTDSVEFSYYPQHCLDKTYETELIDELKKFEDRITIIKKNSTNGFIEEEAQIVIKNLIKEGYENWVVIGCCTDICIKAFALTLKAYFNKENLKFDVIVPICAVETYDAPCHNANTMNLFAVQEMKMNGVIIVNDISNE